jgi:hypothetical protein
VVCIGRSKALVRREKNEREDADGEGTGWAAFSRSIAFLLGGVNEGSVAIVSCIEGVGVRGDGIVSGMIVGAAVLMLVVEMETGRCFPRSRRVEDIEERVA